MVHVLEKVVVECIDYAHDGRGVAKIKGIPIFIENLLIGEKAEIEIYKKEKGFNLGRIIKRLDNSKERIIPICPNYEFCGGCHIQHMTYKEQLSFKRERVYQVLKRIGGLDLEVNPVLGMNNPYKYRNKVQVPFSMDYKGRVIGGFFKKGTHQIIDMEKCYIENEEADEIVVTFKKLLEKYEIEPYLMQNEKGFIRYLLIRRGYKSQEIMVVIVSRTFTVPRLKQLVVELVKNHPNITTIVQNINSNPKTSVILGEKEKVLYGSGTIKDELCGLNFTISSKSFYQVNPSQTEVLYNKAIEFAELSSEDVVLDAYCGIGTIGLIASKYVKKVIGVETVNPAIINAKNNAKKNNISNAEFYCDDASKYMIESAKRKIYYDVAFVDPPRNGCDKKFIDALMQTAPKKIVYISCEPSSLARDLKILSQKYIVKNVQPVDMFPQTYHVETIVLLCLKDVKK